MMADSPSQHSTLRLVLIPALISLGVTGLRLLGELQHWSPRWFSSETGGVLPSGTGWIIGITWLPIPFGILFALKLSAWGQGPSHAGRAIALAVLGILLSGGGLFGLVGHLPFNFPTILIFVWLAMAIPAIIQLWAWRALFKVLLAYGLATRIPVAVVMFLAMLGNWGTHYDYVGVRSPIEMGFWPRYLWLAFFPQLVFWVSFTILIGSFTGCLTFVVLHWRRRSL